MARRVVSSLPIHLDPGASVDLNEQIYREIRRAIAARIIRPNTQLASSRALARDLGVSRTTTQFALEKLQAEGYLVARRGSGTFVAARLPDEAPARIAPAQPPAQLRPVAVSERGAALGAGMLPAQRIDGPSRAFRIGVPALEQFPIALWSRLAGRRIAALTARELDYGNYAGLPRLREAIAEHTRLTRGTRCEADQVYIVSSARRGLEFACRVLLDPGARAAVEDPGYPGAWSALSAAGAQIVPIPIDAEGPDIGALARAGVELAYVTPSHQFPCGVVMSPSRRLALLAWAAASGAWIIEDDYDCEFRFGASPVPCLQGLDAAGRVIYVGTFSKSIFPALRLAFLIAPAALHDRFVAARAAMGDAPPAAEQAILAEFIAEGHFASHLRRMRALYGERLAALVDAATASCAGALALRPVQTGLHAVADLTGADATRVFEEAMRRGVESMPLSAYSLAPGARDNALVLGFGAVGPDRIRSAMAELAAAIDDATG